jgi:hypothetical protein
MVRPWGRGAGLSHGRCSPKVFCSPSPETGVPEEEHHGARPHLVVPLLSEAVAHCDDLSDFCFPYGLTSFGLTFFGV